MDPKHGRGAPLNDGGRFESQVLEMDFSELPPGEERPDPRTTFYRDHARSILTRNDSPDVGFSLSVNAYRGCEHGCVYCYARPTHEYLGLSAGLDFETKIFVKHDAPALLRKELLKPSFTPETITMSGITDCYQPAERKFQLTRQCLEVLSEFRNPVVIITKNNLVTRDLDLLARMAEWGGAKVFVSVTSLDAGLAARLEPRTSRPAARLAAIRALSGAGVPVGVMVAPVVPGLTDHEMPSVLEAAAEAGAVSAGYVPVRLPHGVGELLTAWLEVHFPERKEKVLNRIRSLRGGKLNDPNFNSRMRGRGEFADLFSQLFHVHTRKLGLNQQDHSLSTAQFRRPGEQFALF